MRINVKSILYTSFAIVSLLVVMWFTIYTVAHSEFWDFNVFYSSAQTALRGENIYRTYGPYDLPYWYFPWVAWFFIPLAIFSFEIAKIIYTVITFLSAFFIIYSVGCRFNAQLSFANQMFVAAMSLLMSWLLFRVGQMDFILVALITATILLIDKKQNIKAGFLFPLLLFKPHLLIIFIPFAILRGGKKYIFSASLSILLLGLIAFILMPNWPLEMVRMLNQSGHRTDNIWNFTTFSELIGRAENWSGTANIPITALLALLTFITAWKNQHLPTASFLAFTLSASLLCAPRAYSYNFPFLLPSLLWLSVDKENQVAVFWLIVGILALAAKFSTGAYLIVIATFVLSVLKAHKFETKAAEIG
jgi:hypothetical protein